jgi:hypothetical protein
MMMMPCEVQDVDELCDQMDTNADTEDIDSMLQVLKNGDKSCSYHHFLNGTSDVPVSTMKSLCNLKYYSSKTPLKYLRREC